MKRSAASNSTPALSIDCATMTGDHSANLPASRCSSVNRTGLFACARMAASSGAASEPGLGPTYGAALAVEGVMGERVRTCSSARVLAVELRKRCGPRGPSTGRSSISR